MIIKSWALTVAVLAAAQFTNLSANADTVNVHGEFNFGRQGPAFWADAVLFDLPTGFTNATFTINSYFADDSSVAFLNQGELTSTGIGGPGMGAFTFDGVTSQPYNFLNENAFTSFTTLFRFLPAR